MCSLHGDLCIKNHRKVPSENVILCECFIIFCECWPFWVRFLNFKIITPGVLSEGIQRLAGWKKVHCSYPFLKVPSPCGMRAMPLCWVWFYWQIDIGTKPPGLKFIHPTFMAPSFLNCSTSAIGLTSVSQFASPIENDNGTFLVEKLWKLNDRIHIQWMGLELCGSW